MGLYTQQFGEDKGCIPADLLEAMNDREEWRERVSDIRAIRTTWWWWQEIPSFNLSCICRPTPQPDECGKRPFYGGSGRRAVDQMRPAAPKKSRPIGIPLKKESLRRQAINIAPTRRVGIWGDGPLGLEVCPETWHTRPDLCPWHHGQLKCVPLISVSGSKCVYDNKILPVKDVKSIVPFVYSAMYATPSSYSTSEESDFTKTKFPTLLCKSWDTCDIVWETYCQSQTLSTTSTRNVL